MAGTNTRTAENKIDAYIKFFCWNAITQKGLYVSIQSQEEASIHGTQASDVSFDSEQFDESNSSTLLSARDVFTDRCIHKKRSFYFG